jgi:hypothetical protein
MHMRRRIHNKVDNQPHSERGLPWPKGGGHRSAQCVHPGAGIDRDSFVFQLNTQHTHMRLLTIEMERGPRTVFKCKQLCSEGDLGKQREM